MGNEIHTRGGLVLRSTHTYYIYYMHSVEQNGRKLKMGRTAGTINFPDCNPDWHESTSSCRCVTAKKQESPLKWINHVSWGREQVLGHYLLAVRGTGQIQGHPDGGEQGSSSGSCAYESPRDLQNKHTSTKWMPESLPQRFEFIWSGLALSMSAFKSCPHNSHVQLVWEPRVQGEVRPGELLLLTGPH